MLMTWPSVDDMP